MATPLFDQVASQTDGSAWSRWRKMPDNEAMLLTKRELADLLEVLLSLSDAIQHKSGGSPENASAEPIHQLVKSILSVTDRKIVIDGGEF